MTCVHLRKLYELCQTNDLRLTGADLVHVVCKQCGVKEVCPAVLVEEYEWQEQENAAHPPPAPPQSREKGDIS